MLLFRFDLDQPNNQLSFSGVASGKKANIMFDELVFLFLSLNCCKTGGEQL